MPDEAKYKFDEALKNTVEWYSRVSI